MSLTDVIQSIVEKKGIKCRDITTENDVYWLEQQTKGLKPQDLDQYMSVIKNISGLFKGVSDYLSVNDPEVDFIKGKTRPIAGYINNTIPNALGFIESVVAHESNKGIKGIDVTEITSSLEYANKALELFKLFGSKDTLNILKVSRIEEERKGILRSEMVKTLNYAHIFLDKIYDKLNSIYSQENK